MAATHPRRFRRLVGVVLVCYWTALLVSTHVPLPEGTLSGGSDKLAHFAAYAGLAFLLGLWISVGRAMRARHYLGAFGVVTAYGIIDELLQTPVGRDTDPYDMLADGVGGAIGLALLFVTLHVWDRFRPTA